MVRSDPVKAMIAGIGGARALRSPARLLGTSAFRVTALVVAAFVLTAAMVVGALFWQTNALLTSQVLRALETERAALEEVTLSGGIGALQKALEVRSGAQGPGRQLLLLLDASATKIGGNLDRWPAELSGKPQGGSFQQSSGAPAVGLPILFADGSRLLIARDLQEQSALIARMRQFFLIGFGLLSLIGLVGGLIASRLMLARVAQITDAGTEIMAGDLSRRIPLSGSDDEFDHLATHLNVMLQQIEQLMNGMREVSDNIAHDLKTPLSRLRSRAEAALRGSPDGPSYADGLGRVIEDADALIQTFNALLLIARLEAGAVEKSAEVFDLNSLLGDVAELYEPVAEEAAQSLDFVAQTNVMIKANRQLIGQAVANLIDNAIKYGAPRSGGTGAISLQMAATADGVRISVTDRGTGIAAADRARVRNRFVRLDQSRTRPGTGLGLSLVAAVARLHGGEMLIEDNAPGLRVVVVLPPGIRARKESGHDAV